VKLKASNKNLIAYFIGFLISTGSAFLVSCLFILRNRKNEHDLAWSYGMFFFSVGFLIALIGCFIFIISLIIIIINTKKKINDYGPFFIFGFSTPLIIILVIFLIGSLFPITTK
jgi:hypothetical protein